MPQDNDNPHPTQVNEEKQLHTKDGSHSPVGHQHIEHHHSRVKSKWTLYMMCLNASLGIFFLGFNQGVFNVVQLIILELKGVDDDSERSLYSALMSSSNPLGGFIGGVLATYVLLCAGTIKRSFFVGDILGIIGTVIILLQVEVWSISVGRFIQGFASGISFALVPVYIKEFSPIEYLGTTGSFVQIGQKTGLVSAYLFGLLLPSKKWLKDHEGDSAYDNEYEWRIVICVPIAFCLLRMLCLLTCFNYDTPNTLLKTHHEATLKKLYHLIYKEQDFEDAYQQTLKRYHEMELQKMSDEEKEKIRHHEDPNSQPQQQQQVPMAQIEDNHHLDTHHAINDIDIEEKQPHKEYNPDDLTEEEMLKKEEEFEEITKKTRCRRTALGWTVSLTVSFSGIDAIFYYSNKIMEDAGLEDYATVVTISIGVSAIIFSFMAMTIIDKVGRRPLLLFGSLMMTLSLLGMVIGDLADQVGMIIVCIIAFMFGYNFTLGPIKYACYLELMDSWGVSVAASLIFFFAFVIALAFPFMVEGLNLYGAFSVFLGLSVVCFIYLFVEYKETKGKTKYEIYPMFLSKPKKVRKDRPNYHDNIAVLQMHAQSAIMENVNIGGKKGSRLDLNSIHKSFRESIHAGKKPKQL